MTDQEICTAQRGAPSFRRAWGPFPKKTWFWTLRLKSRPRSLLLQPICSASWPRSLTRKASRALQQLALSAVLLRTNHCTKHCSRCCCARTTARSTAPGAEAHEPLHEPLLQVLKRCLRGIRIPPWIPNRPRSTSAWEAETFEGCSKNLKLLLLGNLTDVASVGDYAFRGCSSVSRCVLPSGVVTIGRNAFARCTSLAELTLPAALTSIGDDAFYGCSSLTSLTFPRPSSPLAATRSAVAPPSPTSTSPPSPTQTLADLHSPIANASPSSPSPPRSRESTRELLAAAPPSSSSHFQQP